MWAGASVAVDGGAYKVENNKFNSPQSECIKIDTATTNFMVMAGSAISVPTNGSPGGYPSIYAGCHWGTCANATTLPLRISGLGSVTSSWSTTQPNPAPSTDAWNVAYDLWFNSAQTTGTRPDRAELMVWLNFAGTIQPRGGSPVGTVTLSGTTYQVWHDTTATPPYIAYVMTSRTAAVSNLNLLEIVNDASTRGFLDRSWYLIAVEAGFEVWNGGAGLATNSFVVDTTPGGTGSNLSAPLNIWWPADSSLLVGTQPFKARLENISLSNYRMFWSVDGGQLNAMSDNATGGDHKEASVDLSGWTWRDGGDRNGPFSVAFTPLELSGGTIH